MWCNQMVAESDLLIQVLGEIIGLTIYMWLPESSPGFPR